MIVKQLITSNFGSTNIEEIKDSNSKYYIQRQR